MHTPPPPPCPARNARRRSPPAWCFSLPRASCATSFVVRAGTPHACVWNGTRCGAATAPCEPRRRSGGHDEASHRRCLLGAAPCDETAPCAARYPHRCLAASVPLWSQPLRRLQCCMRCCVRFWMRTMGLDRTESSWMALARRIGLREQSEDWVPSRLQPHANGEVLLGEMAVAALAHGNVIALRKGRARARLTDGLAHLAREPLLLLHSNEAEHVGLLLDRLNATAASARRAAVSLVSRDDDEIPSAEALRAWRGLRSAWRRAGAPAPQWFVQNLVASATEAPAADGLRPFPIGLHDPNELSAFLARAVPSGLEARVAQRRTLLMCCCMQTGTAERRLALAALRRNGFACNASDAEPAEAALRAVAPAVGGANASLDAQRRRAWRYYAVVAHSKFVASPEGHGRDCYRTWEALALGAIPILRGGPATRVDRPKYANVPVVWVRDWEQVTPAFLRQQWGRLRRLAEERPSALEARGAHFPFWLHELTAAAVHGGPGGGGGGRRGFGAAGGPAAGRDAHEER